MMAKEQRDHFLNQVRDKLVQNIEIVSSEKFSQLELLHSAVLVPITYHQDEFKLIYTKRSSELVRHKGQVSFPGGIIEQGDKSPIDTALRETYEEINIQKHQIDLLGMMEPFNSQTGFFIYPVVGFIQDLNGLKRNGTEVDRIFCIPFQWLADPKNSELTDYKTSDGNIRKVWLFEMYENELLWGITALITKSFLQLVKD